MRTKMLTFAALLGAIPGAAMAHEGDIGLLWDGFNIITAIADDATGSFEELGAFVFGAELIDPGGGLIGGDAPGFFTTDGPTNLVGSFDPGTVLSYQTMAALRAWNGADFSQAASPRLAQDYAGQTILTPETDSVVDGFEFLYAGGDFDEHPDYSLVDAAVGVYLWEIRFTATAPTGAALDTTGSLYVVFNYGVDEEIHDEAIEWVKANLPAPGTGPAVLGALALASRRRRWAESARYGQRFSSP